ncbi:MAG: tetratricopeptide repeat protein [Gemmatimonadota bacterium]
MNLRTLLPAFGFALLWAAACAPRTTEDDALRRGDIAFAQGSYDEALAEYRLAVRQGADDATTLARVAETYARLGRVDDAGAFFREAAATDPDMTDEAVAELMHLAREARKEGDTFAMATAVQTALELRPGVGVGDMSLDLARHYFKSGEYGRALPFYQKAMAEATDSAPEIVMEVGRAYEEVGDCEHALVYFERYREMVRRWQRGEVDWYIGTCSFNLAREFHDKAMAEADSLAREAVLERSLQLVERALEVAQPRSILGQAWFEKGEILSDLGQCSAAMEAYAQVRYADAPRTLVDRAQDRFDQIRFGRGLESLRGGRCR